MTPSLNWFSRDLTDLVHPLVPGRLYVVLAPTGTGKTLVSLNLIARWLQDADVHVTVAATEETPRYPELLACWALGVSYAHYFYGELNADQTAAVDASADAYRHDKRLSLIQDAQPTIASLISDCMGSFRQSAPQHVIVLDHIHALAHTQHLPSSLDDATSQLRDLAASWNVPIVICAQVHRPQARDPLYAYRIPTATSALGSSKIEQTADVILGISRKLRDDTPRDAMARLARGLLNKGESVRDYEERNTARITVLKHRMDDEASRRSLLLTVNGGKMQDRMALTEERGDAYEVAQ